MEKINSSHPLKVTILLPSLSAGGAERVLITLMNGLDRSRFRPSLYSIMTNKDLQYLVERDIPVTILEKKNLFAGIAPLWSLLKSDKPDIVVSTMAHMNFIALTLKPSLRKSKFIVREAITPSFFFQRNPLRTFLIKTAYKYHYPRADAVVSPSQQIIDELKNDLQIAGANYALLYNPVSPKIMEHDDCPAPWVMDGKIHFVASGRLHPQKGFDRLIEKLAHFSPAYPWHLHILGQGPLAETLQQLIDDRNLSAHITLEGHKDAPWDYYRHAHAFLLPSRWEGLPNVALESLACGTPVIASAEAGAIAEIAALAAPGDVYIAGDMTDFIERMAQVAPTKTQARLPEKFQQSEIIRQFEELLLRA